MQRPEAGETARGRNCQVKKGGWGRGVSPAGGGARPSLSGPAGRQDPGPGVEGCGSRRRCGLTLCITRRVGVCSGHGCRSKLPEGLRQRASAGLAGSAKRFVFRAGCPPLPSPASPRHVPSAGHVPFRPAVNLRCPRPAVARPVPTVTVFAVAAPHRLRTRPFRPGAGPHQRSHGRARARARRSKSERRRPSTGPPPAQATPTRAFARGWCVRAPPARAHAHRRARTRRHSHICALKSALTRAANVRTTRARARAQHAGTPPTTRRR